MGKLPKQRRTGLFSATQTKEVRDLARAGLRNPALVSVKVANAERAESEQRVPTSLENYYTVVERDEKVGQLVSFMREHEGEKGIVFFLTCACVDFYAKVALRTAEFLAPPCPNPLPPPRPLPPPPPPSPQLFAPAAGPAFHCE